MRTAVFAGPNASRGSAQAQIGMFNTHTRPTPGEITDGIAPERAWWSAVGMGAVAGGMGWGIRGQYGHETGAMMAGLLTGLALIVWCCRGMAPERAARAGAWGTVAMGFGGAMTYGQTLGLTQDAALIGHWDALRWGMLGLGIKGLIWIGFAGVFLGMGLGGVRYRPGELALLFGAMIVLWFAGFQLLNQPYDPEHRQLPTIYFSEDWRWNPEGNLKPRREVWGGLLFALAGLVAYARGWRKDRLACRLGLWGMLGGGVGFPLGQCLQAAHAWNPGHYAAGLLGRLDPYMNWWNVMETTFGATMGAALGFGLWLNRRHVVLSETGDTRGLSPRTEVGLLTAHLAILVAWQFGQVPVVDAVSDLAITMGVLPVLAAARGGLGAYGVLLPVTVLPIAGKTLGQLGYSEPSAPVAAAWLIYLILPMTVATLAAFGSARAATAGREPREPARWILLLSTWLYFGLNYAFFHFPWPWAPWTGRTPSGIVFTLCAAVLTGAALQGKIPVRLRSTRVP